MAVQASAASASLVRTGGWGGGLVRHFPVVRGIEFDSQGRVLIADAGTGRVARIATDGSFDPSWDAGQPAEDWKKTNPADIAIDEDDNVYVLDRKASSIRKYDSSGTLLKSWTVTPRSDQGIDGIAATAGSIFTIDHYEVQRFDTEGNRLDTWGGFETEWVVEPQIRADGNGHLLVTGSVLSGPQNLTATKSIYRFEPDGELISKWTTPAEIFYRNVSCGDGCDYEEIVDVEGFIAVAPLPSGEVWTSVGDNFITKYGPSGPIGERIGQQGNGRVPDDLATTPGGDLLYSASDYWAGQNGARLTRLDPTGVVTDEWTGPEFPKYTTDLLEGQFDRAEDLTVNEEGVVASFDSSFVRAQFFDSDGGFQRLLDAPETESDSAPDFVKGVSLIQRESGDVDLISKYVPELLRYDQSGTLIAEKPLDTGGTMLLDATADGESGYLALSINNSPTGTIQFLDQDGMVTDSFSPKRDVSAADYSGSRLETDSTGSIYLSAYGYVEKYTRSGRRVAAWTAPELKCHKYRIDDIATDEDGGIYAIAARGRSFYVLKFSSNLKLKWEERAGPVPDKSSLHGYMDVGPDGSLYLDIGDGIEKFDQSGASAKPINPTCPPPKGSKVKVLKVKYFNGRRAARIRISVPEAGRTTISGQKVVRRSRKLDGSRSFWMKATLKSAYRRHRKSRRLTRTSVKVRFNGRTSSGSRGIVLRLQARKTPRHR